MYVFPNPVHAQDAVLPMHCTPELPEMFQCLQLAPHVNSKPSGCGVCSSAAMRRSPLVPEVKMKCSPSLNMPCPAAICTTDP